MKLLSYYLSPKGDSTSSTQYSLPRPQEPFMTPPIHSSSETLVRFSRRSMAAMLVIVPAFGAMALAMTLWPEGAAWGFMAHSAWVVPIAIVILAAALRGTLRGRPW